MSRTKVYMSQFLVVFFIINTIEWRTLALDSTAELFSSSGNTAHSTGTLARLYATIRNVALPSDSIFIGNINEPIKHRLVMLLPGKILHYYDYFPGDIKQEARFKDGQDVFNNIPPRVMENMFHLTDAVPGVYPLQGTESGESMSAIYRNILHLMEVKGFIKSIHRHSNNVMQLLKKEVADPRSPSKVSPLFQLYRQLKNAHIQARLEMENSISSKRKELSPLKFEDWYQRNFPFLNSKVEGAFTELQMMQRKLYNNYRSELGVGLIGLDLEEAKVELRASALPSLDRSRTIYPVSFAPMNWYQYLATAQQKKNDATLEGVSFSRDQILTRIGNLLSKKQMLEALRNATHTTSEFLTAFEILTTNLTSSNELLSNLSQRVEKLRQNCYASRLRKMRISLSESDVTTPECVAYEDSLFEAKSAILNHAELYACHRDIDYQINQTRSSYQKLIEQIDTEILSLQLTLEHSAAKLTNLARQVGGESGQSTDSQWLAFDFDSKITSFDGVAIQQFASTAANYGANAALWSVKSSQAGADGNGAQFRRAMNRARVKVKGELLRVTVNRPWFRPSLFENTDLMFRDKTFWVSPGPLAEDDFISTVRPGVYPAFQLPQYVSGLLLSRNIEMQFDVQVDYSTQAVRESTEQLLGGFAFWSASLPLSHGRVQRAASIESSDTGIRVLIPGVQLIGYYTQIVSRFPHDIPLNFL